MSIEMKVWPAAKPVVTCFVLVLATCQFANAQGFGQLKDLFNQATTQNSEPEPTTTMTSAMAANEQVWTVGGYSQGFEQVRAYMDAGDYATATITYQGGGQNKALTSFVSTKDAFLRNVELGTLAYEQGDFGMSVEHFNLAEADAVGSDKKERKKGLGATFGKLARGAKSLGAGIIGREGLAPYGEADFERILQLNYLTLSYLLEGEFSSFNVTKRAIVSQTLAREAFLEELDKAGKTIEDYKQEQGDGQAQTTMATSQATFFNAFSQYDDVANRVPDAYVNPLGYFVNAIVLEIDSVRKPELRGNARESYRKALELAPNSKTLEAALSDLESDDFDGTVVHVIVAKGFAPTRQVLTFGLQVDQRVVPLKLPVYAPNLTNVSRIDVALAGHAPIQAERLADIEAIVMRSQKDRLPIIWSKLGLQAIRSVMLQNAAGQSQIGALAYGVAEGLQMPDTRSWASLPAEVDVTRLHAPAGASSVVIRSVNASGEVIASQTVNLAPDSKHVVVYARATGNSLVARVNEPLWIAQ